MKKTICVILTMGMLIISGAGCRVQTETSKGSDEEVDIKNFSFEPEKITAKKGAVVLWKNEDAVSHTVTADDGNFNSGQLSKGEDFSQKFSQAGEFSYHCEIHPYMKATVIIE